MHAADLDRLDRFASFETSEHLRDAGNSVLTTAAEEIRKRFPELEVGVKLSRRKPIPALHASVRPGSTIVVGSRGTGGFGPLLLGSTGLEVVIGSPAPVVVVRGEPERENAPVTAAVRDEHDVRWLVRAGREALARERALRLVNVHSLFARFDGTARDETGRAADRGEKLMADLASGIRESAPVSPWRPRWSRRGQPRPHSSRRAGTRISWSWEAMSGAVSPCWDWVMWCTPSCTTPDVR